MLIELRCVTRGGVREEVVPVRESNLNSETYHCRVKFVLSGPFPVFFLVRS